MAGQGVLIIGDLLLDKFIFGDVSRVSPEAPVPLVDIIDEKCTIGGAGNMLNNIRGLGGKPHLISAVGNDLDGDYLLGEMKKMSVESCNIFRDKNLRTTVVSRVQTPAGYQLLRLEKNPIMRLSPSTAERITKSVKSLVCDKRIDVIIISDYGHGLMVPSLISDITKIAREAGIKVVVNPKKENFWFYEGVDIIRTNRREASYATGITPINETSIRNIGSKILSTLGCRAVVISWVEEGMALFEQGGRVEFIPPVIDRFVDLLGVGDAITATLALSINVSNNFREAAELANYAGAFVASQKGLVVVNKDDLRDFISSRS